MNPRIFHCLTLLCAIVVLPAKANGPPIDPLWEKARAILALSKNLVAGEVTTYMEMFGSDGGSLGKMRLEEVISGWKGGEPVRKIVSNDNPQYADAARSRFKVRIDSHPDEALMDGTGPARHGDAILEGKSCAFFSISGKKGKLDFTSKVWIENDTGLPLKAVHQFSGAPMMKSMTYTILFGRTSTGHWVPFSAAVDANLKVLFQSGQIVNKYQYRAWMSRPSTF